MSYKVVWRDLNTKVVINESSFDTIEDAISEARVDLVQGSRIIEIVVLDGNGQTHFSQVFGAN